MSEYCCEVCGDEVDIHLDLVGCDRCALMFGPCCNSVDHDDYCNECSMEVEERWNA